MARAGEAILVKRVSGVHTSPTCPHHRLASFTLSPFHLVNTTSLADGAESSAVERLIASRSVSS
jgi:hypothetical protein